MIRKRSDNRVIRSNVWAILACFVAAMGTAVVANAGDDGPQATKSASAKKQIKKLKRQLSEVEARLAALEGKPAPPTAPLGGPPTGPAGGDLSGSYPSPEIGPQTVGASEIVPESVGSAQLSNGPITLGQLDASTVGAVGLLADFGVFGPGGEVTISGTLSNGAIEMEEVAGPANPSVNKVRIYARDSGGLTQLVARFADGNIDVLAVEAP